MSSIFDENPAVEGPDYVALVIEWDEIADDLEQQLHATPQLVEPKPAPAPGHSLAFYVSVLGAAVLAWRIVHRLRA